MLFSNLNKTFKISHIYLIIFTSLFSIHLPLIGCSSCLELVRRGGVFLPQLQLTVTPCLLINTHPEDCYRIQGVAYSHREVCVCVCVCETIRSRGTSRESTVTLPRLVYMKADGGAGRWETVIWYLFTPCKSNPQVRPQGIHHAVMSRCHTIKKTL